MNLNHATNALFHNYIIRRLFSVLLVGVLYTLIVVAAQLPSSKKPEIVMSKGMQITAETPNGAITITALSELERTYAWDSCSGTITMIPRTKRWYGSLGLYYPGPGEHWKDCNGISRAVVEEGQQHFNSLEAALAWISKRFEAPRIQYVYRDDGLLVTWGKNLPRKQLNVEVWQILINGEKPSHLNGSNNNKISVKTLSEIELQALTAQNDK